MKRILKFGTSHCGMCKRVSDVFKKEGIEFDDIDCEERPDLAAAYHIRNVPVVIILEDDDMMVLSNYGEIMKNLDKLR